MIMIGIFLIIFPLFSQIRMINLVCRLVAPSEAVCFVFFPLFGVPSPCWRSCSVVGYTIGVRLQALGIGLGWEGVQGDFCEKI